MMSAMTMASGTINDQVAYRDGQGRRKCDRYHSLEGYIDVSEDDRLPVLPLLRTFYLPGLFL